MSDFDAWYESNGYMKYRKWFALIPYRRMVRTDRGFEAIGIYWMRPVLLTWTLWNGWTAFAEDNDD